MASRLNKSKHTPLRYACTAVLSILVNPERL